MVRLVLALLLLATRAPHPRGDGPAFRGHGGIAILCSPPAWGWSANAATVTVDYWVLPTRVGMVRSGEMLIVTGIRAPHPRGDGPTPHYPPCQWQKCSPPAWGWSALGCLQRTPRLVLPTRVGMVRVAPGYGRPAGSAPHPRGDGPHVLTRFRPLARCSPPAWGWSACPARPEAVQRVLPTRVGMVRPLNGSNPICESAPHPRGDGPFTPDGPLVSRGCSPPAWGWSDEGDIRPNAG